MLERRFTQTKKMLRFTVILLVIIFTFSCSKTSFESISSKDFLTKNDSLNIDLVKWILKKETGIDIQKNVEVVTTKYSGGIPLQLKNFPVYYKLKLDNNDFENIIKQIREKDSWKIDSENDNYIFMKATKFDLSCIITMNYIKFGFRNVDGIMP